jgi:Arm DNA-binding domain
MASERRLSPNAARTAGIGRHADGGSLYLDVLTSGSRRWLYRYRFGGKVKDMSLGDANVITLADARGLRDKWRRKLTLGFDPIESRRAEKVVGVTFAEIVDQVLASDRIKSLSNAKHRASPVRISRQIMITIRPSRITAAGYARPLAFGTWKSAHFASRIAGASNAVAIRADQRRTRRVFPHITTAISSSSAAISSSKSSTFCLLSISS